MWVPLTNKRDHVLLFGAPFTNVVNGKQVTGHCIEQISDEKDMEYSTIPFSEIGIHTYAQLRAHVALERGVEVPYLR